jgi:hypothetical protein
MERAKPKPLPEPPGGQVKTRQRKPLPRKPLPQPPGGEVKTRQRKPLPSPLNPGTAPQTTMKSKSAPPNMTLDVPDDIKKARKQDMRYDGAIVGSSQQGSTHDVTPWSNKTDWTHVPGVKPNNGKNTESKILYVNGMTTGLLGQGKGMQQISNRTGHEVVGVHNGAQPGKLGGLKDLWECTKDKMNIGGSSTPRMQMTRNILQHLEQNYKTGQHKPLDIIAHSQGCIITGEALRDVRTQFKDAHPGMTPNECRQWMNDIYVQTAGSGECKFPKGPHYLHHINIKDPIVESVGGGITGPLTQKLKHGEVRWHTQGGHNFVKFYSDKMINFNDWRNNNGDSHGVHARL